MRGPHKPFAAKRMRGGVILSYLQARDIQKRFGGVVAVDGVDFSCEPGEVHALLGANGSGKSTLAKIITGVVNADSGEIYVDGKVVRISSPADIRELRIAAVYQELSLIPQLTTAENILLGNEPTIKGRISHKELWRTAAKFLDPFTSRLEREIPLHATVADLSPADQQIVEIAKALCRRPKILILDEATASLRSQEVEVLFDLLMELRDDGCAIVFISHRMEEVMRISDRATVLRNGKVAATVQLENVTPEHLVDLMVGNVETVRREETQKPRGKPSLTVRDLNSSRSIRGVNLEVHSGEIVGLGGLQGQGQSEVLKAIFGAYPAESGSIELSGKRVHIRKPVDAIREGIVLVPGNRAREGLCLPRPVLENVTLPSLTHRSKFGLLSPRIEQDAGQTIIDRLHVELATMYQPASSLSGGNQQKIVVGKWLLANAKILLMDDPTKGVDVRTRHELYRLIRQLCQDGACVLINSSDNSELVTLCDRVLVMYEGCIIEELAGEALDEQKLVSASLKMTEIDRKTLLSNTNTRENEL